MRADTSSVSIDTTAPPQESRADPLYRVLRCRAPACLCADGADLGRQARCRRGYGDSAIAEINRSIGERYLPRLAASESDPQTQRVLSSAMSLTDALANVPVHVIPCLQRRFDGNDLVVASSAWASIIPAACGFLLALLSRGPGSAWTTMHLAKEREVAELLGIPDTLTQAALFPVAYTIGTDFRPASRPPAEAVTFWDHWG